MYRARPRRNKDSNEVRGPNSALTQFLKEQGISAENIRERWLKSQKEDQNVDEEPESGSETESDSEPSNLRTPRKSRNKDKRPEISNGLGSDSDSDLDFKPDERLRKIRMQNHDEDSDEEESEIPKPVRKTRSAPLSPAKTSSPQQVKANYQQKKRRRQKAANLLDKKLSPVSSLQDICVKTITKSILERNSDQVYDQIRDALGGVSLQNLNKLAQALTKNRALNDSTLQLFLNTQLKSLTFYDCSRLSYDGYKKLAIFSPHLESLSLQMCGQLNNEALLYIAEKLPNLKELYLDGPFLINEKTWIQFFELMKDRLQAFHLSNTHRFDDSALSSMLINCGPSLKSLGLSILDSVTNYALLPQYLNSTGFHTLKLEEPSKETDINDEVVINILSVIGQSLKHLALNKCSGLTDSFMINGFLPFVPISGESLLESLEFEELDQITGDGLVLLFSSIKFPFLKRCSLKRCLSLDDSAMTELLLSCASTLEDLNVNGLKSLTTKSFAFMACPNLKKLNIGFIRCVTDKLVEQLAAQNERLSIIEVYGDNLVTAKCETRRGVSIIGRQSDGI